MRFLRASARRGNPSGLPFNRFPFVGLQPLRPHAFFADCADCAEVPLGFLALKNPNQEKTSAQSAKSAQSLDIAPPPVPSLKLPPLGEARRTTEMRVQRVATQGKANPQTPPNPVLTCANPDCRLPFTPIRKWQKYHSAACRFRSWNSRKKAPPEPAVVRLPRVPPRGTRGRTKAGLTIYCVVQVNLEPPWKVCRIS